MSAHRLTCLAPIALAALAAAHVAQSSPGNSFVMNNGDEGFMTLSNPSVGVPVTQCPNPADDWFWQVIPKELLNHPNGVMELSGIQFRLANTDSSLPFTLWNFILAPGKPSTVNPGSIEPDFGASLIYCIVLGGSSGFPPGCSAFPGCCDASGCWICPPLVWDVSLSLTTGSGPCTPLSTICFPADGNTDYTISAFAPPGMSLTGGMCNSGNYTTIYSVSTDENQPDWLGTGISAYGGLHTPVSGILPNPYTLASTLILEFVEPTTAPYVDLDGGPTTGPYGAAGLAGLRVPLSSGAVSLGVQHFANQAALDGDFAANDLAFCAATLAPPLGSPLSIAGALGLLDPSDPVFGPTLAAWTGPYTYDSSLFGDVVRQTPQLPVPGSVLGLELHTQCFQYDLLTGTALESNVATSHFH